MKPTALLVVVQSCIALAVVLVASCGSESREDVFHEPSRDGSSGDGGGTFPTTDASQCTEVHCSSDLHSVLDCDNVVVKTCPDTEGCGLGGNCVPACEAAMASKSTIGCEYYSMPVTYGCYAVVIANTWSTPLTVAAEADGVPIDLAAYARIPSGAGQSITYTPLPGGQIPPKEVALLFLSSTSGGAACPPGIARSSHRGPFHITTSAPVVAYDVDPYGGGASAVTSASLLIPTSAWDTNYVAIAPWPFGNNTQNPKLTIVAAEDATDVTISPIVDIGVGMLEGQSVPGTAKGVPRTYTLQKGQTLSFEQQAELTGSPILATKPIGVMGSSGCINIDACCCDAAHQQIPPVRALGSEYVAVRYRNRVDGREESPPWRIVGAVDGTTLTYEPSTPSGAPIKLSAGELSVFRASGPFVVRSQDSSHPIYLAGYMTAGGDFGGRGDPEFVNVVPSAEYLGRYVFVTDPTYPETNLVLVRRRGDDGTFKDVTLDCAGVVGGWQPIGASKYEYTRIDLVRHNFEKQGSCDNGRHEIVSDAPFGLTVWGWGSEETAAFNSSYVSYAYPGGASLKAVNQVIIPPSPK